MRSIVAIIKRDFKAIVMSPLFLLICGLCATIWSYSFLRGFFQFAQATKLASLQGAPQAMNLHYSVFVNHISYVNIIFIFCVPALTMRLLAEEKKSRTYDLLLTSPITSASIALGKFFAGWLAVGSLVLVSFIYPLVTALVAEFSWAPVMSAYVGVFLMAGIYVSVGLFASSLTESVLLAVILGVTMNLIFWFIGAGGEDFGSNQVLGSVIEYLSIGQHFLSFLKGTYSSSSLIFFLSFISFFIFLSERVIESARWR